MLVVYSPSANIWTSFILLLLVVLLGCENMDLSTKKKDNKLKFMIADDFEKPLIATYVGEGVHTTKAGKEMDYFLFSCPDVEQLGVPLWAAAFSKAVEKYGPKTESWVGKQFKLYAAHGAVQIEPVEVNV